MEDAGLVPGLGLVPCFVPCGEFTSERTRFGSGLVRWWIFTGWNARGTIVCPQEERTKGRNHKLVCGRLCP